MALTKEIDGVRSPIYTRLEHCYKTDATGNLIALITGVTGKRIRIWRMFITCAAPVKSDALLSGLNPLTTVFGQSNELKSSDGIPVFTCNSGEDFKADPSDGTAWYYYIVYSIE